MYVVSSALAGHGALSWSLRCPAHGTQDTHQHTSTHLRQWAGCWCAQMIVRHNPVNGLFGAQGRKKERQEERRKKKKRYQVETSETSWEDVGKRQAGWERSAYLAKNSRCLWRGRATCQGAEYEMDGQEALSKYGRCSHDACHAAPLCPIVHSQPLLT
jgi:hypothetical protein